MEGRLSEHQYGIGIAVVGLMFLSFVSLSLAIRDSNCASYVVCAHPWPDETGYVATILLARSLACLLDDCLVRSFALACLAYSTTC